MIIALEGNLDATTAVRTLSIVTQAIRDGATTVDLSQIQRIDHIGAAVLLQSTRNAKEAGIQLTFQGLSEHVRGVLSALPAPPAKPIVRPFLPYIEVMGLSAYQFAHYLFGYTTFAADLLWYTLREFMHPRHMRWDLIMYQASLMGARAFPIIALIAFLIGGTLALQAVAQLRQFGASVFVVDLLTVSITRELGPLITAILIAGRSGSAVAAQLGAMVISEEVDALRAMGLAPLRFLVTPRAVALILVQPLLTVLTETCAIFGGFVMSIFYLDIGPEAFVSRLYQSLYLKDMITGLVKSIVFANIIISVSAYIGLSTYGGTEAVGNNTTKSVVASISGVIVADAICSLLFYFGA
jgi:phospholipid/cholesterol/gamma-HCH transport system permease protein